LTEQLSRNAEDLKLTTEKFTKLESQNAATRKNLEEKENSLKMLEKLNKTLKRELELTLMELNKIKGE